MAAHIAPTLSQTPNQGFPKKALPAANTRPCAGGYIDMYVGRNSSWKVSKWIHIGGVGLVSLSEPNVSAASKKLNSSWAAGWGTGKMGRIASRIKGAEMPTRTTARDGFLAMRPAHRSTRPKNVRPNQGAANARRRPKIAMPASQVRSCAFRFMNSD